MMTKKNSIGLTALFQLASFYVAAQSGAVSPYTYFGIGETESFNTSRYNSMGQTGIALSSNLYLNSRNPASLSSIPASSFLYDFGLQGSVNTSKSGNEKQTRFDGGLANLKVGLRLNDYFAASLGMEPVSQSKYKIGSSIPIEGTSSEYPVTIEGEGGLTRVFSSLGFKLNDNLSLGGTINYYFGSVDQLHTINVNSETITDFVVSKENKYAGIGFGLGLQYRHQFSKDLGFTFGGILNFKSKIAQNTETNTKIILSDTEEEFSVDEIKDNVYLPLETGVGMALDFGKSWTVTADYTSKKWEKLDFTQTTEIYKNENIFGLGAEYRPKALPYQSFHNKLAYRMGISYSTGNFKIVNDEVDKASASIGLGIPVTQSGMSINLGYSLTKRGWISDSYVKDTYHLFTLSFSGFENWFVKKFIN